MKTWLIIPVCIFCIISIFMFTENTFSEAMASDGNQEIIYNDNVEVKTGEDEEVDIVLLILGLALMIGFAVAGVLLIIAFYRFAMIILSFFLPTGEELENSSRFVKFLARIVQRHFR